MTDTDFYALFKRTFTDQQKAAIERTDGATLLLAVPGSGKTTVIVARTGYLLLVRGVQPGNILTLTFTKAAAKEMEKRFISEFPEFSAQTPRFSTINAFCLSVISRCKQEKGVSLPTLVPNPSSIIRRICRDITGEFPADATVSTLVQTIGKIKNEMMPRNRIMMIENSDIDVLSVYDAYIQYMNEHNLMDFDDQLLLALKMLETYPDILARIRGRYRYISLDEAQDTSYVQHKIVQMMAGESGNIFMVGDEDQSIYGFRGAYPDALLNFKADYKNAAVLLMETNYRSDSSIVATANAFIKRNASRENKEMRCTSKEQGGIYIMRTKDMKWQAKMLSDIVKDHLKNTPDSTLAILSRDNASCIPVAKALMNEGIPFQWRDATDAFTQNFIVSDVLDILRFAKNPRDLELFSKIYYKIGIFIKKPVLNEIGAYLETHPNNTILYYVARIPSYKTFSYNIPFIESALNHALILPPARAIGEIMGSRIKYWENWISKKISGGASEFSMRMKVNYLMSVAEQCKDIDDFMAFLDKEGRGDLSTTLPASVTLSTIHGSKGLEYDRVILIDVVDGIFPSRVPGTEPEEENRLFYVAMTRARHELDLIIPSMYYGEPIATSEFFETPPLQISSQ